MSRGWPHAMQLVLLGRVDGPSSCVRCLVNGRGNVEVLPHPWACEGIKLGVSLPGSRILVSAPLQSASRRALFQVEEGR